MARKRRDLNKEIKALHQRLKESIKELDVDIKRQRELYAKELTDYERLYGKYEKD